MPLKVLGRFILESTTTIDGQQLPPPPPKFGGTIEPQAEKSEAWWPPRVVPPEDAPNILLIMTDDQGIGDFGATGNRVMATPNLDKMAANSAAMSTFYVSPVCSPTRAEFLTGRYHPRSGVYSTSAGGERMDVELEARDRESHA